MEGSKRLAGLVGPVMMALGASEALHMNIWAGVDPTLVYLNGTLLLIGGLALVRAHNLWVADWRVLVTLVGWVALVAGLYRMFMPYAPQLDASAGTYVFLALLFGLGGFLSFKAYFGR